jgi:hypothetical protein
MGLTLASPWPNLRMLRAAATEAEEVDKGGVVRARGHNPNLLRIDVIIRQRRFKIWLTFALIQGLSVILN